MPLFQVEIMSGGGGAIHWTQWVANLAVALSAAFAAFQYQRNSALKASETLLKIEEEFRRVSDVFFDIEDEQQYRNVIAPALCAGLGISKGPLTKEMRDKLAEIEQCLRFLYLCCVINQTLRSDHVAGEQTGVVPEAYYYYIGILLNEEIERRPELNLYTAQYYPRLRHWVDTHTYALRAIREKKYWNRSVEVAHRYVRKLSAQKPVAIAPGP